MSVSISPENCEYRAEGNAGIVIRLIKEKEVLRLRKQDVLSNSLRPMSDDLKELEDQIKIARNVLKPILGESFVHCPVIVFLHAEEIKMLNERVSKFRPAHRRHQNVEPKDSYVSLLPDYCCLPHSLKLWPSEGPVLSIEIKPKQGFMKEEYFPGSSSSLPIPMCRCCMMKHYKFKRGILPVKSEYCPTDLFSGCYTRMFHAIKMLCKTPQNNFRIFKDQRLVYSEELRDNLNSLLSDFFIASDKTSCMDILCDVIIQALLKPFPHLACKSLFTSEKKFSQDCINAHTVCAENDPSHELPASCVLGRILNCQLLDNLTISDVHQLYQQVKQSQDKYSDNIGCHSRSEIPSCIGELRRNPSESEYEYASRKVWEFLLALTVKDCSIMLVLRRLKDSSFGSQISNGISDKYGNLYMFSIAIADLDVKALDKVEKTYKDMCLILKTFDA